MKSTKGKSLITLISCLAFWGLPLILPAPPVWGELRARTNDLTPRQVALQRWYHGNSPFPDLTGFSRPAGIAFDGTHMWVANRTTNTLSKVRASDGAVLGNYAVGQYPGGA